MLEIKGKINIMANKICHKHYAHRFFFLIYSVLIMLVSFTTTIATITCSDKERHALLHFKSYIHHDPDGSLSSWTPDDDATNDCCSWSGVTCNNYSRVTILDLRNYNLEGKISPSLFNLSHLNWLYLSDNSFHGTIPKFIGSMTQLTCLDLGFNSFTGTIPMSIGSLTQLTVLDLSSNNFTGTVPLEFGNLTNLQQLSLSSLSSCTIETLDWLSHMSKLETLDMSGTSLGKADNWVNAISSLKKLVHLDLGGCDLWRVKHPYSYSSVNSSLSSILRLYLGDNNLNSSMHQWLFPLTSNKLQALDLSQNKLDGIPKYLGNLCSLDRFLFMDNAFPVKFPDFLNNLSGCTSLSLSEVKASSSQLTGPLSDDIQQFSSLLFLSIENNQINGISEKLWQLPKLERLDISSNFLKGAISENIGKSNIPIVNLSNNSLEGIPLEARMSNLSGVEHIDLRSCNLGPRFPKWIQKMKNLTYIDISNSRISSTIPEEFWNTWASRLTYLNMSSNNITCKVTNMLSNFDPGTSIIDLSSNNFYGPIPHVPSSLTTLSLSRNRFSGEISFLCQIVNEYIEIIDLSYNSFTGRIPDCLWNFTLLTVLSLGNNNLSGRLPASIKNLVSLEVLYLYNNSFAGEFPSALKNFSLLNSLDLGANNFSGYIPVWIGERLPQLYALSLTSNNFFGTIPSQLCQLVYLQILDLSMNNLQGAIPTCLNNLTSMAQGGLSPYHNVHYQMGSDVKNPVKYVDHAMVRWQGSLREFSSTLGFVKIINFSSNNLTGKIPNEVADLHKLIALNFSMNAVVGEIPSKIGQMKELQILDLSRNDLKGEIPASMAQMTLLNYLDVSYNSLSGRIPSGTQLQSFEPSRYTPNAGLCGLPVSKYCPGDKELEVPPITSESEDDDEGIDDNARWFYIGGVTGFSTGFWMVCIALLVNRHGRHAFFHSLERLKSWVYVKVMVFIAKLQRVAHP